MKKLLCFCLTLLALLSCGITALAANTDGGTTVVSTKIASSYLVTIPDNKSIVFNTLSTPIGSVKLESARLEPYHAVRVSVSYGKLKNEADPAKTIEYMLKSGSGSFTGADFTAAGQSAALTIDITQAAWNSAYAGRYADTITFTWSDVDLTPKS